MSMLGERAWWLPRWLGRLLPDLDVEGSGLRPHDLGTDRTDLDGTARDSADDEAAVV
jgi:RND superfamily putative drug exporter